MNEKSNILLPKYKCHKEVSALLIKSINITDDGDRYVINRDYGELYVEKLYYEKHSPEVGGYYVLYNNCYESYSPKEAFESGYKLIKEEE